jgi:hypothetical protein
MAAERGTIVVLQSTDLGALGRAAEVLAECEPIRLDVLTGRGARIGTVITEAERAKGREVSEIRVRHTGVTWELEKRETHPSHMVARRGQTTESPSGDNPAIHRKGDD